LAADEQPITRMRERAKTKAASVRRTFIEYSRADVVADAVAESGRPPLGDVMPPDTATWVS
jgi:hypothetical protein